MHTPIPSYLAHFAPDAYLVGGAVRDAVRGRRPVDCDVAVAGDPSVFARKLARSVGGRVVKLGKARFDLYRVVGPQGLVDVTAINGPDIESDLLSRDFTINALACRLDGTRVIDCTGGLEDLGRRTIRMVSATNLHSDPVRLLRAHRLAADLGFEIEPETRKAIRRHATGIQTVAGERIWAEWQRILFHSTSHTHISAMAADGLLEAILPELSALRHCTSRHHARDALTHTLAAYEALEALLADPEKHLALESAPFIRALNRETRLILKMAILLHDIGKPDSRGRDAKGHPHYHGHAARSAALADRVLTRLCAPNRIKSAVGFIVLHHQRPLFLFLGPSARAMGRFHRVCGEQAPMVLLHAIADARGKTSDPASDGPSQHRFITQLLDDFYSETRPRLQAPRLLTGRDLMDHFGLVPSPLFKKLLDGVEEARLAGLITQRDAALAWVANELLASGAPLKK